MAGVVTLLLGILAICILIVVIYELVGGSGGSKGWGSGKSWGSGDTSKSTVSSEKPRPKRDLPKEPSRPVRDKDGKLNVESVLITCMAGRKPADADMALRIGKEIKRVSNAGVTFFFYGGNWNVAKHLEGKDTLDVEYVSSAGQWVIVIDRKKAADEGLGLPFKDYRQIYGHRAIDSRGRYSKVTQEPRQFNPSRKFRNEYIEKILLSEPYYFARYTELDDRMELKELERDLSITEGPNDFTMCLRDDNLKMNLVCYQDQLSSSEADYLLLRSREASVCCDYASLGEVASSGRVFVFEIFDSSDFMRKVIWKICDSIPGLRTLSIAISGGRGALRLESPKKPDFMDEYEKTFIPMLKRNNLWSWLEFEESIAGLIDGINRITATKPFYYEQTGVTTVEDVLVEGCKRGIMRYLDTYKQYATNFINR